MAPEERFRAIIDAIGARIEAVGHGEYRALPAGYLSDQILFVFDGDGTRFKLSDDTDPDAWKFVANDQASQWVDHAWKAITFARG